ncbi:Arc family DNA-binding protein [Rhizobium aouanii]|uniref:Arc family DNA-binding protein n=1 Tax=Rhizobium aouanii TaxID=3118145 RepID=A0ABU8CKC3_9HYPH
MKEEAKLLCRLPQDVKEFLARQSEKYGSSMNSEVVRCIRERMVRTDEETGFWLENETAT